MKTGFRASQITQWQVPQQKQKAFMPYTIVECQAIHLIRKRTYFMQKMAFRLNVNRG